MSITEHTSKAVIIITPPPRDGVDWNGTKWEIQIELHPDYSDDGFDEPIELIDCNTEKRIGLYPENAEELGRALLRAVEIRRAAVAKNDAEEFARSGIREDGWSEKPPIRPGTYWHWSGDGDDAPLPVFVLGGPHSTNGECFVSAGQLGLSSAIDCKDYGGWWKTNYVPSTPDLAKPKGG